MNNLNKSYWNERYDKHETGWDAGEVTTPLKTYIEQLLNKHLSILIPGAGNAHEGRYLSLLGFKDIHLLDISDRAISLAKKNPELSDNVTFHCEDFFQHEGSYDLILEQTFFCAIDRKLRRQYAEKIANLLNKNGRLVGLLWAHEFGDAEPPYGGSVEEYSKLFVQSFEIKKMELAYNSIKPRQDREIFINLLKK